MKGFGAEEFLGYIAYNVMCMWKLSHLQYHLHTSCFYSVDRMCNVKTFAVLHNATHTTERFSLTYMVRTRICTHMHTLLHSLYNHYTENL